MLPPPVPGQPPPPPPELFRRLVDAPRILSRQSGALISLHGDVVEKSAHRVKPLGEAALRLVRQYTSVPVPTVHSSSFSEGNGNICMDYVDGEVLDEVWPYVEDDRIKESICRQIWDLIYQFRIIPKPGAIRQIISSAAPTVLPTQSPDPLASDDDLRRRIYERYLHFFGRRYEKELPDMLPRSKTTVFTHADIAPGNIIVGEGDNCPIITIIDWEGAGCYPEYWEYANIMKRSGDRDWQEWIDRVAPEKWDISGIVAARRVLF